MTINKIETKIRSTVEDKLRTDTEVYEAGSGRTFTIACSNVQAVTSVAVNGTTLATNLYTYASQTVTINVGSVASGNVVSITFTYYKYSTAELLDFIKSALVYLDSYNYSIHFDLSADETEVYPIPQVKEQSLIVMVASILIRPDFVSYSTGTVSVRYPNKLSKEERIEKLILKFSHDRIGCNTILDLS